MCVVFCKNNCTIFLTGIISETEVQVAPCFRMMLLGSHFHRRPFPATMSSSPVRLSSSVFEKPEVSSQSLSSFPAWMTQALGDLSQSEQELQQLREWQTAEVDKVNQGLDSAILGAQKEERYLLERVEQIHRDTQQQMQQIKRENAAAIRVGQSLVDRQLRKVSQLREQIHMWGRYPSGPNKSQLLRGVRELIQPWEISLSLKNVHFQPCQQPSTIPFGEVIVQENNLSFPVGVCGPQGHKCAIHSGDLPHENHVAVSEQVHTPCKLGAVGGMDKESSRTNTGTSRVVRKIRISTAEENALGEDAKLPSPKPQKIFGCKRDISESSQDEELESPSSDIRGDDLFLAIHPVSSQGESEDKWPVTGQNGVRKHSKDYRNQRTLLPVSSKEPSFPPEDNGLKHYKGSQGFRGGMLHYVNDNMPPTKSDYRGAKSSYHSYLDLSSKEAAQLSQCSGELRRPSSPADSIDSNYTFIVRSGSSRSESMKGEKKRSISTADLSTRGRPLINEKGEDVKRKMNRCLSESPPCTNSEQGPKVSENWESKDHSIAGFSEASSRICRSLSLSAIEGKATKQNRCEQKKDKRSGERPNVGLFMVEEEKSTLKVGHLVKKIGKQGSGRTDFTLPSGVHVTPQGQLFVVDCGNVRVQITDLQRNVVQQISPPTCEGTSRHCRNFFDVAGNSKGLIALTCVAERVLLVFSRHGRLLQTFGGSGSAGAQQDLEAPRGVTVTQQDEFLVADIRRGTLTALKLDPKTGAKMERTVVTGFHRPYLVATCLKSGLIAVSERGNENGRAPCIKVLEPGWNTIRILGICSGMGPVLSNPWGICIDADGDVLVADWGKQHCIVLYPPVGVGRSIVSQGLSSPRGLAVLPDGHLVVSDSMNHCIKIYHYK
uniref:E3 ubiquitin-protein ligase TRIM32 n=1 Tax=Cyprinus carpio carpio TaxID=630221 RepID=A0A9J8D0H7_CYPCA